MRLAGAAVVAAILAIGLAWFVFDVTTDDEPSTDGDTYARIDAYVEDQIDDARIPGAAIAIVEGDEIVHAHGFGNDGRGNEVTPDTPFWIGSNTKSITALAAMQLVESGAIDLDAPVQQYLPEFRVADAEASASITIRHLLNQTSGLSRSDGLRVVIEGSGRLLEENVAAISELSLNRPVGERFEYSNLNSAALGLVIERVTGRGWAEYVHEEIFTPLGMRATFTSKTEAEENGLAANHRMAFGFPIATDGEHLEGLAPTGYVYSTANDVARYLAMYLEGGSLDDARVLSEDGIASMLAPATNERQVQLQSARFTARYGAGWFVGPFGVAEDARWHQGSLPHFTAWMVLLPETQQGVVVLLNAGNQFEIGGANRAWSAITEGVVNILREEPPPSAMSPTRFFIIFDTVVAAILAYQLWSLFGIGRRLRDPKAAEAGSAIAFVPLLWEAGLAVALLLVFPSLTGGLGWGAAFTFIPDLAFVVVLVAAIWLVTAAARVAGLVRGRRHEARPA